MSSRTTTPVLAVILGAALLGSCTPSGAGPSPTEESTSPAAASPAAAPASASPAAAWLTELPLPAGSLPAEARTLDGHLVPATADAPPLMVTVSAEPGAGARLALARVPGSGDTEPVDLGINLPGEIDGVEAASSPELVAIAGTLDDTGRVRPYVLTSQDRSTWRLTAKGAALAGHSVVAVAVAGSTVHVTTQDAAGLGHVTSIVGDAPTTTPLEAAPGAAVWPGSVAAVGDDVVVIGMTRPAGRGTWIPALWTSHDGGATFISGTVPEPDAENLAVVRAKDAWVVTGTVPDGGDRRPASWSSRDGATWKADRRWKPGKTTRGDERKLGAPTVGPDGRVRVWLSDADFGGNVYERDPRGRWRPISPEPMSDAPEPDADAWLAVGPDGTTHVLRIVGSWAQLQRSTADAWEPVALLSAHDPVREASSARTVGDAVEVTLAYRNHRNGEHVSTSQTVHERIRVGDTVLPVEMPPGLVRAESASNPATGAQVTIGNTALDPTDAEEESPSPSLWLRTLLTAADGTVSRSPLDLSSVRAVDHVSHVPGLGYLAALDEAATFDEVGLVAFAHSRDGEAWTVTKAATLGGSSPAGSSAWDMCSLPDGKVVALGESAEEPVTWAFDGSGWTRSADDALPASQLLETCVSTPESAVVTTVDDDGLTRLWTTTDGVTFTPAGELPDEGRMRSISRAGSIYVAAGRVTTPAYDGNVVWLSQDAVSWRRVALPVRGTIVTHAHGSDAVVAVGHVGGPRVFRLDVEAAWADAQAP